MIAVSWQLARLQFETDCNITRLRTLKLETRAPKEVFHAEVVSQHHSFQRSDALFAGDINDAIQKIGSKPVVLMLIGHYKSHFSTIASGKSNEPGNSRKVRLSAFIKIRGNERYFIVIVNQTML